MALTYRYYRSNTIGDGLTRKTAFRSVVIDYLMNQTAGPFTHWTWGNRIKPVRFDLVLCDSTVHTQIAADAGVVALSGELADLNAVSAWLDQPAALSGAMVTKLESDGFPCDWVTAQTTRRQLFRFFASWTAAVQRMSGTADPDYKTLFQNGLDTTVNQVPVAIRNKVKNWMIAQGLDSSWVINTTTIRAIVKFIAQSGALPVLKHGDMVY